MTVLQALKVSVGYPLDEVSLGRILIDRGLSWQEEYAGATKEFMLARADIYMSLVTSPDVSMDGFSLSVADRSLLAGLAENIYRRYDPSCEHMSIARNVLRDCSDMW